MSYQEKSTWGSGLITFIVYGYYLLAIEPQFRGVSIEGFGYASTMLWAIMAYIVATIVLHIIISIISPSEAGQEDQRDRDIYRFGEYVGQYLSAFGAFVALMMALAKWDYFWIANAIYLGFGAATFLSSIVKIVAYRRGL